MCFPLEKNVFAKEKDWIHAGLQCVVVQGTAHEHRCGYVRVPPNHPDFGKDYDSVDVDVHGGLTFGQLEPCEHEDGQGYWYGFDCAHYDDAHYEPGHEPEYITRLGITSLSQGHFWTLDEVIKETERLAEQLAAQAA